MASAAEPELGLSVTERGLDLTASGNLAIIAGVVLAVALAAAIFMWRRRGLGRTRATPAAPSLRGAITVNGKDKQAILDSLTNIKTKMAAIETRQKSDAGEIHEIKEMVRTLEAEFNRFARRIERDLGAISGQRARAAKPKSKPRAARSKSK